MRKGWTLIETGIGTLIILVIYLFWTLIGTLNGAFNWTRLDDA